jgi:pyruvate dehydrogenase E2 component (dihydrolipoamide acetyltransferase)
MTHTIIMPDVGQTTAEAKILKWLKMPGEKVAKGDHLVEVETDKVTMEVESYVAGYLRQLIATEGQTVNALAAIALVTDTLEEPLSFTKEKPAVPIPSTQPVAAVRREPAPPTPGLTAAPAARLLARELGLDLALVPGTGPGGLITRKDVEAFARQQAGEQ